MYCDAKNKRVSQQMRITDESFLLDWVMVSLRTDTSDTLLRDVS